MFTEAIMSATTLRPASLDALLTCHSAALERTPLLTVLLLLSIFATGCVESAEGMAKRAQKPLPLTSGEVGATGDERAKTNSNDLRNPSGHTLSTVSHVRIGHGG
jgi:hypothetical protein